ncbi:hypothetical protein DO97_21460 [Neosynechococcus sphagnicola sy1]|uniref:RNA-binding protein containing Zn ribbon n=1 Tax=Neosynechococcus sphagnicola sy1 TaxID=1497020 RepID=A0A098TH23_9CYAN|nr:DciA family protein [Neosynechococcus sphagnicola]KGF71389.1 hypothetical protein DO97_21460 [Neosynechococcus sphagnicola sy1]
MTFQSLDQLLGQWQSQQPRQQQFQHLVKVWPGVVGAVVAAQTRPISIYQGTLRVATASAAWAQNLTFERRRILIKLNTLLTIPVEDIRFTPGQWQQSPKLRTATQPSINPWADHPSQIPVVPPRLPTPSVAPQTAFQHWATVMRARSQSLPLCPHCHAPCPPGELERWGRCSLCAAKQW